MISMAALRQLLEELGCTDVRTLLQSGNVVFRGAHADEAALEREVQKRFGHAVQVILRSPQELASVIAKNPYPKEAKTDPGHLLVVFLKSTPVKASDFFGTLPGPEYGRLLGKHAYIVYPEGVGRSRLTHVLIEKKLGVGGTARNWNTVQKLAAIAGLETAEP